VRVLVPDYGGGFGGNHPAAAGLEAARISRKVGAPVKVKWTRTEEFTEAYFRPAAVIDAEASLDDDGNMTSWFFVNINSGRSAVDTPYRTGRDKCEYVGSPSPLSQGSYRALAATANNFAREAFMDELAGAAGRDPLEFRMAHLENERIRAVLQTAAERFGWQKARNSDEPGVGAGLACGIEKGSVVAACAEVTVRNGELSVDRACEVFEAGAVLNPENLRAQVEGCVLMGLGAVLREEVRFDEDGLLNPRFSDYHVPRFSDVPDLDIHLLDRPNADPAGGGETPIIAIAPAVANAVYDATGERVRELPIRLSGSEEA
jgi:isoquinoline 1-oxidoreductase